MILSDNFRSERKKAIDKLSEEKKLDSFGYHIDVNNWWETVYNTNELISYLSIHNTHASKYNEFCYDMFPYIKQLKSQFRFHSESLETTAKYFTTRAVEVDYKYDLLELGVDWLAIDFMKSKINSIVDYGAGCGRQAIGAIHNCKKLNCYIGVDASTNGYMVQNGLFSTLAIQNLCTHTDLIDHNEKDYTQILPFEEKISKPHLVHFPAWTSHNTIRDKSIDLVMACHVHNEIGPSDFDRLISLVDKKMSSEGIFYVRSELGIWGDKQYEDVTEYHAVDPIIKLKEHDIIPIASKYFGGFQTTIFARNENSLECKRLIENNQSEFWAKRDIIDKNCIDHKEVAFHCAENYVHYLLEKTKGITIYAIDDNFEYGSKSLKSHKDKENNIVFINSDDLDNYNVELEKSILLVSSIDFHHYEDKLSSENRTRLQYLFPFIVSLPFKYDFETEELLDE